MKKNIKLISLVITAILLVGAVVGISVSAETEGQAIRIAGQNIAYEGAPQILYLVETKLDLEEGQAVKLVYSTTAFDALAAGAAIPEGAVVKSVPTDAEGNPLTVTANGNSYYPLFSDGIAPQYAAKAVYACPVIVDAEDNIVLSGKVVSYDVRQYARNRFTKGATDAQVALYTALLDYAASIQEVLMDEDEINANGGYADAYAFLQYNTVINEEIIDTENVYVRSNIDLTVDKYLDARVNFSGFTDADGNVLGTYGENETSATWNSLNVPVNSDPRVKNVVNSNYTSYNGADKKLGRYYYTFENDLKYNLFNESRFTLDKSDTLYELVSYMYNGSVIKYPVVTTITSEDATNGDMYLTVDEAAETTVLIYDADAETPELWMTEEEYNALSATEQAEVELVRITTNVTFNTTAGYVSYAEVAESFDGTSAVAIHHNKVADETTLAFNKGDAVENSADAALKNVYTAFVMPSSNNSANISGNAVYVFETDFKYYQNSTTDNATQILFSGAGGTLLRIDFSGSVAGKTFKITSVAKDNTIRDTIATNLVQEQWYNFRIEIDTAADDTAYGYEIRYYVDGKLCCVSEQSYQNNDISNYGLNRVSFGGYSAAPNRIITLDNTYIATEGDEFVDNGAYIDYPANENYDEFTANDYKHASFTSSAQHLTGTKTSVYTNIGSEFGDNVLEFGQDKNAGPVLVFPLKSTKGDVLVWETDFKINYAPVNSNWAFKLCPYNGTTEVTNWTVTCSAGYYTCNSKSSVKFSYGVWYQLRMEYDTVTGVLTHYMDGAKMGTKTIANKTITGFGIGIRSSSTYYFKNYEMAFDNTYCNAVFNESFGEGANVAASESFSDFTGDVYGKGTAGLVTELPTEDSYSMVVTESENKYMQFGAVNKAEWAEWGLYSSTDAVDGAYVTTAEFDIRFSESELYGEALEWLFCISLVGTKSDGTAATEVWNTTIDFIEADRYTILGAMLNANTWYRVKIVFDSATNAYNMYINDILVGEGSNKQENNTPLSIDYVRFSVRNKNSVTNSGKLDGATVTYTQYLNADKNKVYYVYNGAVYSDTKGTVAEGVELADLVKHVANPTDYTIDVDNFYLASVAAATE